MHLALDNPSAVDIRLPAELVLRLRDAAEDEGARGWEAVETYIAQKLRESLDSERVDDRPGPPVEVADAGRSDAARPPAQGTGRGSPTSQREEVVV